LRNFPSGLEIKCTCGNVRTGKSLKCGENRCKSLTAITWQAHHQEVHSLLGIVWDFDTLIERAAPVITAVFYCSTLDKTDWGAISGRDGRNTKVTGMSASGKKKMFSGIVCLINREPYRSMYPGMFKLELPGFSEKPCRTVTRGSASLVFGTSMGERTLQ
jgi:hypothetical protein